MINAAFNKFNEEDMLLRSLLIVVLGLSLPALLNDHKTQSTASSSSSVNDIISIEWDELSADAWYPLASGISEGQSVVVGDKLYVFGGYAQCCIPIRDAYVFDPLTNLWTRLADMPQGTTHTGITTDGTDIYLAGGYVETPDQTWRVPGYEKVWRYNIALDTYTALPDLPKKASTGQLVYLNGKLHYIGGTTPITQVADLPDHFVFDLDAYKANPDDPTIVWLDITDVAPLPNPRQHAGAVVLDGKIYYVGGQHFHNNTLVPQDDVHRYDPVTNQWEQMADMPAPRNHMSNTIVVWNDRIIVVTGQSYHETSHDEIYMYTPADNQWTTIGTFPRGQHSAIAGLINNTIYFATGDKGYNDNERRRMRQGTLTLNEIPPTPVVGDTNTPVPTSTPVDEDPDTITVELLADGDFEALGAWKEKGISGDKMKCNKENKPFARSGECAFMFRGGMNENARIQQAITVLPSSARIGDRINIEFYADARSPFVNAKVRVQIRFSDGTSRIRRDVPITTTEEYRRFVDTFTLPNGNIRKMKVIVQHNSPTGKLFIDDVSLKLVRQDNTLLPLP
jgi:hypothetical protein